MESPPPPQPAETLLSPLGVNDLLAIAPERAAALLRLLDGDAYVSQAAHHAALVQVPLLRVLNEWAELLFLSSEPRKAPPRPRPPRRPSIDPNIPRQKPKTPHGPDNGKRRRWPRIRVSASRVPSWA